MAGSGGTITWGATEITVAVGETKTVTYESTFSSPDVTLSAWSEARNYASLAVSTTDIYHGTVSFTGNAVGEATISAGATVGFETTTTNQLKITVVDPAQVIVAEKSLQDIADAIRGKLGVATTYKPADMASAIESISGGGGGVDISAFRGCTKIEVGVYQPTSMNPNTIPHSLGLVPKLFALYETTLSMGGRNSLIQDLIAQTSSYLSGDIIGGLCYNMMDMLNMVAVPSGMVSFSSTGVTISSTTYKMDTSVSYMYIVIG